MITIREICDFLFALAPADMKESWDNVGLLCGRGAAPVDRVLVALDPFMDVAEEAAKLGAQLIVTHHPLIFAGVKRISDEDALGRTLLFLVENGIGAVNLHTNLDSAPDGVNDCLAAALGLSNTAVLCPAGTDARGLPYGLGRYGEVEPCELDTFLRLIKMRLGCGGLRYADGGSRVQRVAVGGGSCGEFLADAAALGCDTFVTADVKYNQFADARELGVNLIDAGHFPTENVICAPLAQKLRVRFPELAVYTSKQHGDVVKFL